VKGDLAIGQVAARAGLATSAIRYYERAGLLPRAARRSGRRVYEPAIVERLALIRLAQAAGFTVAEIRRLLSGFGRRTPPGERWRSLASAKRVELNRRIAEAKRMKRVLDAVTRCACPTLDDCARARRSPLT
jgi:MerR family redox-sensitive transcriptional activator SoxR